MLWPNMSPWAQAQWSTLPEKEKRLLKRKYDCRLHSYPRNTNIGKWEPECKQGAPWLQTVPSTFSNNRTSSTHMWHQQRRMVLFFFNFLIFIYFWQRERQGDRERECKQGRGRERRRHRIRSRLQSRLWAVSTEPDAWLELKEMVLPWYPEILHNYLPLCTFFHTVSEPFK